MKLYIDTEFNSYRGQLISMAIVDEKGENEFYEVLAGGACGPHNTWVAKNVIPVLHIDEMLGISEFQTRLAGFLNRFEIVELVADYPTDIQHFCWVLETGPGERMKTPPIVMTIDARLNTAASLIPHNALADARALRNMAVAA